MKESTASSAGGTGPVRAVTAGSSNKPVDTKNVYF